MSQGKDGDRILGDFAEVRLDKPYPVCYNRSVASRPYKKMNTLPCAASAGAPKKGRG